MSSRSPSSPPTSGPPESVLGAMAPPGLGPLAPGPASALLADGQAGDRAVDLAPDQSLAGLAEAVARRRNFAIISHPDAGKTTLTEKLLLYGGAIQQAGAVKAKGEQRKVTSDWMELE